MTSGVNAEVARVLRIGRDLDRRALALKFPWSTMVLVVTRSDQDLSRTAGAVVHAQRRAFQA